MEITILYTAIIIMAGLMIDNQKQQQRRNYIIIVTVLLTLVAGLRSIWVGTDDTSLYYVHFLNNSNKTIAQIWESEGKDPLYYVFLKILSHIVGNDYQRILIVSAAFYAISAGYLIYKESKDPLLSYIILLAMGFFFFSMNGLRQALAIGVLMLSFSPLKNRRLFWFILLVAMATAFHKTAAVFLLAYPAAKGKLNIATILLYIIAFLGCMLYGESILGTITRQVGLFDDRFEYYQSMSRGLTYSGLFQLLLLGLFAFARYKQAVQADKNAMILYILLIWAILFQTMAVFIAEMFRVAMYFSIFLIVLIPKVLDTLLPQNKRFTTVALCVALVIYFMFFGAGRVPHHFYFEQGW